MLYRLIKIPARWALKIYCRSITISNPAVLQKKGPLLLAANHPNSFLDAIILCTLFETPLYSLARGDAFKHPIARRLLHALNMLPVYRVREGVENLEGNYETFDACLDLFRQGGTVLIFSEGLCVNEWHLRPLRKGTARLAVAAWKAQLPLQVVPIGLNYSSFRLFGKNVHINVGEPIHFSQMKNATADSGLLLNEVTATVFGQLETLVYEIPADDKRAQKNRFSFAVPLHQKVLLLLPAAAGFVIHAPCYLFIKAIVRKKALHSGHYDSIMVALLLLAYPVYLLLAVVILYVSTGRWWMLLLPFVAPFTAWCYVRLKKQTDA